MFQIIFTKPLQLIFHLNKQFSSNDNVNLRD